ncbi:hypothetical protein DL990_40820 [Amycolatopsis sp. WAC 01416]|uniref:hypothetical protein n=1 Tax=Amycolatopsis sp. WAC 01416 TaxID=2203196 RepID=UPI000F78399A|nr:hypothetical protein [Amycolatopsis sp. WAC 01416]RSN19912.1 hypothetical protein DL990_40820 [Amycolatopsis sp. WAC 01416]
MPATMLAHTTGTLTIEDNTFSLGDRNDPQSPLYHVGALPFPHVTGLLATAPGFVAVTCGVHLGDITITTETWDGPPEPDLASWEDVAEVSVTWSIAEIAVCGTEADGAIDIPITLPPAANGSFRVRDSVRHRDAGEDRSPNDPQEHHLIQIWPETPRQDELLKATDNTGTLWRTHS